MTTTLTKAEIKADLRRLLANTAIGITSRMSDHQLKSWLQNIIKLNSQLTFILMPFRTKTNNPRKRKSCKISCNNRGAVLMINLISHRTQSILRTRVLTQTRLTEHCQLHARGNSLLKTQTLIKNAIKSEVQSFRTIPLFVCLQSTLNNLAYGRAYNRLATSKWWSSLSQYKIVKRKMRRLRIGMMYRS